MADSHETPDDKGNEFTGFINVDGFPDGPGYFFGVVDRVGWIGSQFMLKTPVFEGGSDDPSDIHTYVEPSQRYEVAAQYGSKLTIAALVRAGLLPEAINTEVAGRLRDTLREIEENSTDGIRKEQ